MRRTHPFIFRPYCLAVLTLFCLLPFGCEEPPDSEYAIQETIDVYLDDLHDAVSRNNSEALKKLISSASRLRPATQSQTQSKNLVLSTAKSKLAQLQFESISATTNVVRTKFQRAVSQATQVARLRDKASSLTDAGYFMPDNANLVQAIEYALDPLQSKFNTQLREASARIANLEVQSKSSRDQAQELRETADALFEEAEQAGIQDGHATYKIGVEAMRQSQKIDLAAATIELQTQMNYTALQDEAKAELDAIGSILAGVKYTGDLLQKLRDTSIDSAASLRRFADDLDYESATMMQEAIDASSGLSTQWDEVTNLLQEALQSSGRSRSNDRDEKQATAMWKLNLEWTLGRIQEAKRRFLMEEAEALSTFIDSGIENSAGKWQSLSSATTGKVEEATISAIAAYENANQLASNVGARSDVQARQLDWRISVLQGNPIHELAAPDNAYQTPSSGGLPSDSSSGFQTAQELVEGFNAAPSVMDMDGRSVESNYFTYYHTDDPAARTLFTFSHELAAVTNDLYVAVESKISQEAADELRSQAPPSTNVMDSIDANSLDIKSDSQAVATDTKGKALTLQKTSSGWKIFLEVDEDEATNMAVMMDMTAPFMKVINSILTQVNDGTLTSLEQIEAAMMSEMMGM